MAKKRKVDLGGAYVVKAAESRPSRVVAKTPGRSNKPTAADKRLANVLLKSKSA